MLMLMLTQVAVQGLLVSAGEEGVLTVCHAGGQVKAGGIFGASPKVGPPKWGCGSPWGF